MAKRVQKVKLCVGNTKTLSASTRGGYRRSAMTIPKDFDKTVRSLLFVQRPTKKKK